MDGPALLAAPVINFVQAAQGGTGVGGVTLPAAPTAGNLLVCVASDGTTTPVLAGNFTWTQINSIASNPRTTTGWRIAQAGETAAQQVTSTAATSCVIYEFSSQTGWPANPIFGNSLIQAVAATPPSVTSTAFGPAPANAAVVVACNSNQAGATNPTAFTGATGASITVNITNWKPATGGGVGNGICGYSTAPALDGSNNVTAITAAYSGTVSAGATIAVIGLQPAAGIYFTGNYVQGVTASGSGGGLTLPSAPTQGNVLVAFGWNSTAATYGAGWTPLDTGVNGPFGGSCYKVAGASEPALQVPFTKGLTTAIIAEFHSDTGWNPVPVDQHLLNRTVTTNPPAATAGPVTPQAPTEMLVTAALQNNAANTAPTAIAGNTLIAAIPGTGGNNGNGSAFYQAMLAQGAAASVAYAWTGTATSPATAMAVTLYAAGRQAAVSQTCGCTVQATGLHNVDGTAVGPTGNYVTGLGTGTVVLPSAPTQGNLLIAFGSTTNALAINPGWTLIQAYTGPPWAAMAYKIAGASEAASQQPFSNASMTQTTIMEIASQTGWPANPIDVSSANGTGTATTPPTVTTTAITPSRQSDFAVIGCVTTAKSATNPPAAPGVMSKLTDIQYSSVGGNAYGPGSVFYQRYIGTASYSQTLNWTGTQSGLGAAIVVALIGNPTIHASLSQTVGCTVSATIANPIAVTTNVASQLSATPGSTAITMPRAPTQGNLLVAFGAGANGGPITAASGWKIADNAHYDSATPYPVIAWKIAGASESATQTPFVNASGTARLQTAIVEVYGVFPWSPNDPVDVSSAAAGASATPPTVTTAPVTPTGPVDFAFVFVATASTNNQYPTTPPPGMTLLANISWITTAGSGPASVFYQPVIGTSPYSQTATFGGSGTGVGVGVVAALTLYIRGALSKTCGCTLSATAQRGIVASLSQTVSCTLSATGRAGNIHASLSQIVSCSLSATARRTTHATVTQTVGCTLVATGKTQPIHATLAQTVSCSLVATGTAKVIHASLSQIVSCSLVATGGQPVAAWVAQVVLESMMTTNAVLPFLTVAQVVIEGMASYQIVPLQVAQVAVEYMAPNVYPYNPQPPEAFAPP